MLESYSAEGSTWGGDPQATDNAIGLDGIDDLTGALAALETQLLASEEPDEAGLCAGSLGACLLSALLVEAVTARIAKDGLPRPICVTAGSSGVYPYFDAPVAGMPAAVLKAAEALEGSGTGSSQVPGPRYSSLLVTSIPRARKRAVLVLEDNPEQPAEQQAERFAALRAAPVDEPVVLPADEPAPALPPEEDDALPIAAETTLLLTKKPPRAGYDFRDMLSPREDDLQQRLQNLIAPHLCAPPAQAREAEVEFEADPVVTDEAGPDAAAPTDAAIWLGEPGWDDPAPRRSAWPWARLKAWWTGSAD